MASMRRDARHALVGSVLALATMLSCARTQPHVVQQPRPQPQIVVQTPIEAGVSDASTARVIWHGDSPYGSVWVVEDGNQRILRLGSVTGSDQSAIYIDRPLETPAEYAHWFLLSLAYPRAVERVLMIGLGGGNVTNMIHAHMPTIQIDAVEINAAVVEAARRFFGVREDDHYRVHVDDGAAFVERNNTRYDLIMLDAYAGDDIPDALATVAFFTHVRARLTAGGASALNVATDGMRARRVIDMYRSVFPNAICYQTPVDGNLIIVGPTQTPSIEVLRTRATELDRVLHPAFSLASTVRTNGSVGARCTDMGFARNGQ